MGICAIWGAMKVIYEALKDLKVHYSVFKHLVASILLLLY